MTTPGDNGRTASAIKSASVTAEEKDDLIETLFRQRDELRKCNAQWALAMERQSRRVVRFINAKSESERKRLRDELAEDCVATYRKEGEIEAAARREGAEAMREEIAHYVGNTHPEIEAEIRALKVADE